MADAYARLDGQDTNRTDLSDPFDGRSSIDALDPVLENRDLYEKMLQYYANGMASMAEEAEKTADSVEGSMGRLSGIWENTIGKMAASDTVVAQVNLLNGLLGIANSLLGPFGEKLFAGVKNIGKCIRVYEFQKMNCCFEYALHA